MKGGSRQPRGDRPANAGRRPAPYRVAASLVARRRLRSGGPRCKRQILIALRNARIARRLPPLATARLTRSLPRPKALDVTQIVAMSKSPALARSTATYFTVNVADLPTPIWRGWAADGPVLARSGWIFFVSLKSRVNSLDGVPPWENSIFSTTSGTEPQLTIWTLRVAMFCNNRPPKRTSLSGLSGRHGTLEFART